MTNNPLKENINELQDGDHLLSPTLTNLYEGLHGNGILLTEDTAFADTDRNNPANLGGAMSQGANASKVVVKPFQAILNGVLYDFGGGSNITLDLAVGSSDILDGESIVALTSGQECLFVVIATPLGVKVTQTTRITTAAGAYPSISGSAASYLSDLTNSGSAIANQQSTVIGSIRATNSGGTTHGAGIQALSEFNDHRTFIRTSPVYLTTASSNSAGTAGINDHTTLEQIHGSGLHGNFGDAGVLWQSLNSGGETMLYYSRKDSSNRHTHLLGPTNINVSSPGSNQTFTFDSDQVFVLTASTTINLNPSGTFPPGHAVFVSVPSGSTVTFDSTGLNTAVAAGDAVMFAYDGSNWKKVLYSSTVATTSSGASGRVQLSDGAGGFTSDAALYFTAGTPDTLTVDGKLNVTGLIDPTGLVIDEKANVAATGHTTAAGKGLLWVKNDAPNRLYFTDDAGTDKKVVHATDSVTELSDVSNAGSGAIITTGERTTVSGASSANGILKSNGSGTVSAAVANTDYQKVLAEGGFVDGDKTKLDGIATSATAYTNANAIAAVEGESTLDLTGQVTMAQDLKVAGVQYQQFKDLTDDLATGYHTIALIEGQSGGSASGTGGQNQRGIGTFLIRNTDSSRHQTIMLTASHLFGGGNGNGISVEHSSYFSTLGINAFRIKENSTYDGAVLQMNIADATNNIEVYLKNNFQESGWQLITPVADATDPSTGSLGLGYNNAYSTFTASATTSITDIAQLGQHIQGPLVCKNDVTIGSDLNHDGSNVGFFGTAPATKTAVSTLGAQVVAPETPPLPPADHASTQAAIDALQQKLDALISALSSMGLV